MTIDSGLHMRETYLPKYGLNTEYKIGLTYLRKPEWNMKRDKRKTNIITIMINTTHKLQNYL